MISVKLIISFMVFAPTFTSAITCLPKGHEYQTTGPEFVCKNGNGKILSADFNNDGRSDWFCNDLDAGQTDYYALATIAGTFYQKIDARTENFCSSLSATLMTGDINGDGMADLICRHADGETYDVSYYERKKFSTPTKLHVTFKCDYTYDLLIGDINADNVDDFVCVNKASGTVSILYNYHHHRSRRHSSYSREKHGFVLDMEFCVGTTKTVHLADINGDKAHDLICHDSTAGSTTEIQYSLADRLHGFSSPKTVPNNANLPFCAVGGRFAVHDVDGDNHADLICIPVNMRITFILTDSKLLFTNGRYDTGLGVSGCNLASDEILFADTNGDRRADLFCDEATASPPLQILFSVCQP